VYGTLKRGYGNYGRYLLARPGATFIAPATTVNKMEMHDLGAYPFVCKDGKPVAKLIGEVFEVDAEVFQDLDRLEGYPSFYDRMEIPVCLEDGTEITAWIYCIEIKKARRDRLCQTPVVKNGNWRDGVLEFPEMLEVDFQPKSFW